MTCTPLSSQGYVHVPAVLTPRDGLDLDAVLPAAQTKHVGASRPCAGTRALLATPWCAALARQLRQHAALGPLIPPGHVAIQCTYFEKSATRNWLVPLHQDLSIPVAERMPLPEVGTCHGWGPWSDKEGVLFVQAPPAILAQLVAVRLHIDACGNADGPLRVVPGSHTHGLFSPEAAQQARADRGEVLCEAHPGDTWVMHPLLLHASSKAHGVSRRRVLHFVYGPAALPHGLRWPLAV